MDSHGADGNSEKAAETGSARKKKVITDADGGADKKLDSLRAPKGVELKCIRRTKLMLP